jgi:CheY-like chemotaxis protein
MNILVADDDEILRAELAELLRASGHSVDVAADGREALARAPGHDIVLLDWNMPGPSGAELVGLVRAAAPQAAIVVMTGYGNVAVAVGALKAGAAEFIEKPFDVDALERAFREAREKVVAEKRRAPPARAHPPKRAPGDAGVMAAFLNHRTGLLMAHRVRSGAETIDEDILTGTLDAIQSFMRISFPILKGKDLRAIAQGDHTLLIERGDFVYLSLVVLGSDSDALRRRMRDRIADFEERHHTMLQRWGGDVTGPVEFERVLDPFIPIALV